MDERTIARFNAKVDRSGGPDACWPWRGHRARFGHGRFGIGSKVFLAHRVAFRIEHGHWPEPCGCHHCDNPPCCNPGHVYAGTKKQNTADMMRRGRHSNGERLRGERHPMASLSEQQVTAIRLARLALTQSELGRLYGVSQGTIWRILHGKTWRHVP